MRRFILIILLAVAYFNVCAQRKVKDGTIGLTTFLPNSNAVLELESNNRGFLPPRLTTAQRDGITTPANGLVIYNTDVSCIQFYNGSKWQNTCDALTTDPSTNGTGKVSSYICNTSSTGTMVVGTPIIDETVTQTLTASVSQVGTYNIVASANGIVFFGIGEFTATGTQTIILRAAGTPLQVGTFDFELNTSPNCSFQRDIISLSTNGTGIVSNYVCNTAQTGSLTEGDTDLSLVTQTITATVTRLGNYNIQTDLVNGVRFSASGTFTSLGSQTIVLTASGEVFNTGTFTYTLNTTPGCSFNRTVNASPYPVRGLAICDGTRPTLVVEVTSPTGRVWMDRNLGASRAATSVEDSYAAGCLYQWGRGNDGHASVNRASGTLVNGNTYASVSSSVTPGHSQYIKGGNWGDWTTSGVARWQGVNGVNNPCPAGFRVPSNGEIANEIAANNITDLPTAFASVLKFPKTGTIVEDGSVNGGVAYLSNFDATFYTNVYHDNASGVYHFRYQHDLLPEAEVLDVWGTRYSGRAIRCIKDY